MIRSVQPAAHNFVAPAPNQDQSEQPDASLQRVLHQVRAELLLRRNEQGHWRGRLSASALSTAVAAFALAYYDRKVEGTSHTDLVGQGLDWLACNIVGPRPPLQSSNEGSTRQSPAAAGWGDTLRSKPNLPTTLLAWAALRFAGSSAHHQQAVQQAEAWICKRTGSLSPDQLKRAIENLYGEDKTFSVPILTLATLAGVLGPEPKAWDGTPALPFELALLPQSLFRFLGLPVVSYALPALIAVGQVQHRRHPTPWLPLRWLRQLACGPTLRRLQAIQPSSGGFLEAIPLTAFVTLSLVGAGEARHPVTQRCLAFLRASIRDSGALGDGQRNDEQGIERRDKHGQRSQPRAHAPRLTHEQGAWPIDIDLATWVTTLSVQALTASAPEGGEAGPAADEFDPDAALVVRTWLLGQQAQQRHPYTGAAPGGWAWTDLPGGVPDADDTAGALLAIPQLGPLDERCLRAARAGLGWLVSLQNRDGGIPTFCRGWGKLPFDRSAPDLSAHALRALACWQPHLDTDRDRPLRRTLRRARQRILAYLQREQQDDGSWNPLWFGNEAAPLLQNRVFGTARVLLALARDLPVPGHPTKVPVADMTTAALGYLLSVQNADGGWGGAQGVASTVEESALAVEALAAVALAQRLPKARAEVRTEAPNPAASSATQTSPGRQQEQQLELALHQGRSYLLQAWEQDRWQRPAPIGFYFANLWYYEDLYPLVFGLSALGSVARLERLGLLPGTSLQHQS